MNDVKLIYKDIAPNAKEQGTFTVSETTLGDIQDIKNDKQGLNYTNPCELNQMLLDGLYEPLGDNLGWWGDMADIDGNVDTTITISFATAITTQGVSVNYGDFNRASDVTVNWYSGSTLLDSVQYGDLGSLAFYSNLVSNFTKIEIKITKMTLPFQYIKILDIQLGVIRTFEGGELQDLKLTQEISPFSRELSADKFTFNLVSQNDVEYVFQSQQTIELYNNNKLQSVGFVVEANGKRYYDVECQSLVHLLIDSVFEGDMYTNKNVAELVSEICNVPYELDPTFADMTITGYIEYTDRRYALRDLAFAIGAIVSTTNTNKILIKPLDTTNILDVPLSNIRNYETSISPLKYTSVELSEYNYSLNTVDGYDELYNASASGTGTEIEVKFSKPYGNLTISNGTIVRSNANIAIITTTSTSCILRGYPYTETEKVIKRDNPVKNITDKEKINEIGKNTLISRHNSTEIMDKYFDYLLKNEQISAIMDLEHIAKCGDYVNGKMITKAVYQYKGQRDMVEVEQW